MTGLLERLLGRLPIGWLQLTHNPARLAAALARRFDAPDLAARWQVPSVESTVAAWGGSVTGAIHADAVEIRGRVTGVICARRVKLWATARVDGDISHTELAVEAGAHFEGRSLALVPPVQQALEAPSALSVAAE